MKKEDIAQRLVMAKQMAGYSNLEMEDILVMVELLSEEFKDKKYSYFTIEEFAFALKEGCCYRYGEYSVLSFGRIISWVDRYMKSDERSRFLEERYKNSIKGHLNEHRPTDEQINNSYKVGINKEYELFLKSPESYTISDYISKIYLEKMSYNGVRLKDNDSIIDVFKRYSEQNQLSIFNN